MHILATSCLAAVSPQLGLWEEEQKAETWGGPGSFLASQNLACLLMDFVHYKPFISVSFRIISFSVICN